MRPLAHLRAALGGYFWKACPRCNRMFGGHEFAFDTCDVIWGPTAGATTRGVVCCPACSQPHGV